jgi:flagellar biosynthetic protein FliR
MLGFSQLNEIQILMFGMILLRMIGFIASSAILSSQNISTIVKVSLSIILTLVVFKSVATNEALVRLHENEGNLMLLAAREVVVGIALGFVTKLFFFSISMAGELVSVSLGLSQAQIFNPMMGSLGNVVEQFYAVIGTLLYFALNGHHILIDGLVKSFSTIEVVNLSFQVGALAEMVMKAQNFFILGIQIAAPILISMLVVQVGIALLSRTVPQINVLSTSTAITSLLGTVILFVSLPLMVMQMSGIIDITSIEFFKFLKSI